MLRPNISDLFGFHLQRRTRAYVVGFAIFLVVLCYLFLLPPLGFPVGKEIVIPADRPFSDTAEYLEQERVVRSAFVLKAVARVFQADRDVQAGRYVFSSPAGLSTVLYRLTSGISGLPSAQVTLPEGMSAREMGIVLAAEIPGFDADTFVSLATPHEGTLFPDTYDIYLDATPEDVVSLLRATYDEKLEEVRPAIEASGRSEEEIVIMASLLEKEAKTDEDRKMVSGILWDRIEIGMPLQVDAVFGYIHGRDTYHPSFEDLESDSPYNTYTNQGLPPGAIGNPGLAAIRAALTPIETEYLYYLSGTDGTMHYARTFEEHKENREKYLR